MQCFRNRTSSLAYCHREVRMPKPKGGDSCSRFFLTKHGYKMNTKEKKEFNIQFWRFLWASILIGLSACLGNVVDAMIVGNLIDEDAVSAINLSLPFLQFMFTVNMLLATGAGMLVGMELGKKDTRRASYIFVVSMSACLLTGLVLTACGVLRPDVTTRLLCDNEQLYQPTYEYLRVTLIGAPAYLLT